MNRCRGIVDIGVNRITLGFISIEVTTALPAGIAIGRIGHLDIANSALFLRSDLSSYVRERLLALMAAG